MSSMEEKLQEYRRRKKEPSQGKLGRFTHFFSGPSSQDAHYTEERETDENEEEEEEDEVEEPKEKEEPREWTKLDWTILLLELSLWMTVWALAVQWEVGVLFIIFSAFTFMYFNLSDRKKKRQGSGDISAYSVFNKDFKTIDGTLTAQQFEKEIRNPTIL